MNEETGEIKPIDDIPPEDIHKWSKPFKTGDVMIINGIKMELIKIKTMRKELHFKFYEG